MLVKEIMTPDVITVKRDASIREIAETLIHNHISGLPVVDDDGKVCGIVSEGDLMCKEVTPDLPDELCILGAVIYIRDCASTVRLSVRLPRRQQSRS